MPAASSKPRKCSPQRPRAAVPPLIFAMAPLLLLVLASPSWIAASGAASPSPSTADRSDCAVPCAEAGTCPALGNGTSTQINTGSDFGFRTIAASGIGRAVSVVVGGFVSGVPVYVLKANLSAPAASQLLVMPPVSGFDSAFVRPLMSASADFAALSGATAPNSSAGQLGLNIIASVAPTQKSDPRFAYRLPQMGTSWFGATFGNSFTFSNWTVTSVSFQFYGLCGNVNATGKFPRGLYRGRFHPPSEFGDLEVESTGSNGGSKNKTWSFEVLPSLCSPRNVTNMFGYQTAVDTTARRLIATDFSASDSSDRDIPRDIRLYFFLDAVEVGSVAIPPLPAGPYWAGPLVANADASTIALSVSNTTFVWQLTWPDTGTPADRNQFTATLLGSVTTAMTTGQQPVWLGLRGRLLAVLSTTRTIDLYAVDERCGRVWPLTTITTTYTQSLAVTDCTIYATSGFGSKVYAHNVTDLQLAISGTTLLPGLKHC